MQLFCYLFDNLVEMRIATGFPFASCYGCRKPSKHKHATNSASKQCSSLDRNIKIKSEEELDSLIATYSAKSANICLNVRSLDLPNLRVTAANAHKLLKLILRFPNVSRISIGNKDLDVRNIRRLIDKATLIESCK
jgi:hypothetical protein